MSSTLIVVYSAVAWWYLTEEYGGRLRDWSLSFSMGGCGGWVSQEDWIDLRPVSDLAYTIFTCLSHL